MVVQSNKEIQKLALKFGFCKFLEGNSSSHDKWEHGLTGQNIIFVNTVKDGALGTNAHHISIIVYTAYITGYSTEEILKLTKDCSDFIKKTVNKQLKALENNPMLFVPIDVRKSRGINSDTKAVMLLKTEREKYVQKQKEAEKLKNTIKSRHNKDKTFI